jgi:single-strand DNA-binding protein
MSSINKAIILGNIGNLEIKQNSSGEPIVNLSVATSESWKDKASGEKKEKTEWHRIILFGNGAKFCSSYATKGAKVYVEGKITTRKWTDKQGVEKYTTEIIVDNFSGEFKIISSKQDGDGQQREEKKPIVKTLDEAVDDFGDDIPF